MTVRPPNLPAGPNALWDWMERRGLNQREMAAELDMHWTSLNHFMSNRRRPGLANALKIERATGIQVEAWKPTKVSKLKTRRHLNGRKRVNMQSVNSHAL